MSVRNPFPAVTLHALKLARSNKVITVLNTAPAAVLTNEFYLYTDILCMNETECKTLCDILPSDLGGLIGIAT